MSDKITQAALGVSMAVLAYALWKHFGGALPVKAKVLPGASGPLSGNDATRPDVGYGYDPYNPGELILSRDLINGTIADVYTGQTAGDEFPWLTDLYKSVIRGN